MGIQDFLGNCTSVTNEHAAQVIDRTGFEVRPGLLTKPRRVSAQPVTAKRMSARLSRMQERRNIAPSCTGIRGIHEVVAKLGVPEEGVDLIQEAMISARREHRNSIARAMKRIEFGGLQDEDAECLVYKHVEDCHQSVDGRVFRVVSAAHSWNREASWTSTAVDMIPDFVFDAARLMWQSIPIRSVADDRLPPSPARGGC